MSCYFEAAVVSADQDALLTLLEDLPRSGPLAPISLELFRLTERGFVVFGWREGEARPDAHEEIEQLAGELSRAFGVAVAIYYNDQVGWHDAVLCRGGEPVQLFGEEDEVWVPYGDDGELLLDGPRYAHNTMPDDVECDCISDGNDAGLRAAGFHDWATIGQLLDCGFHPGEPVWGRPGTRTA